MKLCTYISSYVVQVSPYNPHPYFIQQKKSKFDDSIFSMSITEKLVLDKKGKPVAVQIPVDQYKKLLDLAEEMEDIKAYDKAMKRKHNFIPFDEAVKELKAKRKSSK